MSNFNPSTDTTPSDANSEGTAPSDKEGYRYSEAFYRYIETGSLRSAGVMVPLILRELSPTSVLDVGCGAGAWLAQYRDHGITDYLGVDGAYVQPNSLLISVVHFQDHDLTQPFNLGRRFDLVQCLEVGEHLPEASSRTLIETLTQHGDKVLFSAATPGQGGENHINEQTHEFWRLLFAEYGYKPFDLFRPMIKGVAKVESWYRYNMILFIAEAAIPALSPAVLRSALRDEQAIPVVSPLAFKIRAHVFSLLPMWCVSKIVLVMHKIVIAYHAARNS
jgi:SAM-dependent methyltransferase